MDLNVNLFDKRNYTLRHKNLNDLINQTIENLNDETQLILWPESAIPYHKLQNKNIIYFHLSISSYYPTQYG